LNAIADDVVAGDAVDAVLGVMVEDAREVAVRKARHQRVELREVRMRSRVRVTCGCSDMTRANVPQGPLRG
jgi:hypothetical protein